MAMKPVYNESSYSNTFKHAVHDSGKITDVEFLARSCFA